LVVCRGQGEDVEDVGGNHVDGEEVDLVGGVGDAVVVEVAFVGVAAVEDGAFDLDAEEVALVVPSVAVALSGQAKRGRRGRCLRRAWRGLGLVLWRGG
jgi:hypothetical protein